MSDAQLTVNVVYACRDEQFVIAVAYEHGLTAEEAVRQSGVLTRYPDIAQEQLVLGVYGTRIALNQVLEPGNRVEVCRPLIADPRAMRHDLLGAGKVMGGSPYPRRDARNSNLLKK